MIRITIKQKQRSLICSIFYTIIFYEHQSPIASMYRSSVAEWGPPSHFRSISGGGLYIPAFPLLLTPRNGENWTIPTVAVAKLNHSIPPTPVNEMLSL